MYDHLGFAKRLNDDEAFRERVNDALIAAGRIIQGVDEEMTDRLMADSRIVIPEEGEAESAESQAAFNEVFDELYDERLQALVDTCGGERACLGYVMASLAKSMDEAVKYRSLSSALGLLEQMRGH